MPRSRVSAETSFVLLASAAAAAWLLAMWFYLTSKGSFFDDTFIYLHIANNAIETGTARYFPLSGSSVLIASSPLRLISIIPAAFVASLVTDSRSLAGATLTMYLQAMRSRCSSRAGIRAGRISRSCVTDTIPTPVSA